MPGQVTPDDEILGAQRAAGLGAVVERAGGLDAERDWLSLVSLSDQQLLVLTRIVLARPRFAFLVRVDTTLGPGQVQQALERLTQNSITPIHLAEAAQSVERYDAVLEIDGDGAWAWRWTKEAIEDYEKKQRLEFGSYAQAGKPIDPSSKGPLGPQESTR
jgi:putative ATP-binding cassette transporter